MANLYYLESSALEGDITIGDQISLTGEDARHAVTVSRLRVGEYIQIGDGKGTIFHCEAIAVSPQEVQLEVLLGSESSQSIPKIWLVQALAKGGRDELAIQMATELGVAGVIPWAADRSVVRWDAQKETKNLDRWRKILREAAKQSIRAYIPELRPLINNDELAQLAKESQVVLLDPTAPVKMSDADFDDAEIFLVVGPEGGFSEKELDTFSASGAQRISLGAEILRTSTAGAAALAALNLKFRKW